MQEASRPSGLTVHVRVPQEVSENGLGLASSSVKDITVALPAGMALNPAGGGGLQACSNTQIGFQGERDRPGRRTGRADAAVQPDAARSARTGP